MLKYNEVIEKIERISKLFYLIFVKFTLAAVVMPAVVITLINYFIYDLKGDSYYVSIPFTYVPAVRFDPSLIRFF